MGNVSQIIIPNMKKFPFIILLCFINHYSISQNKKGFQVLLTHENDILGINNKDENYTGGLKLELLTPGLNFKWLPFFRYKTEESINIQRYGIGGTAYTPQKLDTEDVVTDDRPYACLTYINFGNTSYNLDKKASITTNIHLGFIGLSGPGKVQSFLHEKHALGSTRPVPLGWDNQIGFNGRFIINYNTNMNVLIYSDIKDLTSNRHYNWLNFECIGNVNIGNYMTNIEGGLKLNLININTCALQNYESQMPTLIGDYQTKGQPVIRLNFYAEPIIRYSLYNSTLEGLLFNDNSHSHPKV